MLRATLLASVLSSVFLFGPPPLAAADLLEIVPGDALGFVVVNGLAATDAKIGNLGEKLQLPLPRPLALLKASAGLGPGFDETGRSAVVILPGPDADSMPVPLWYVPISDFGKFAASLGAEQTEKKIVPVRLQGKSLLAGQRAGFAVLVRETHGDLLEKALASKTTLPDAVRKLQPWIGKKDAAVVVTTKGVKLITAKLQEGLATVRRAARQHAGDQVNPAIEALKMYDKLFEVVGSDVSLVGVGLQLDSSGDVRISKWVGLRPGGSIAKAVEGKTLPTGELLAGLPGEPFVFAVGGVISPAAVESLMGFSTEMMKAASELYGLSPEQVEGMMKAAGPMMRRTSGMSMLFAVGTPGEAIYSKMLAAMRVGDAKKFIQDYSAYVENIRKLVEGNKQSLFTGMESKPIEIGGRPGLEVRMDMPSPPMMKQVPQYDEMMEKMVGPGGKIRVYLVAADKHLVLAGYTNQNLLKRALAALPGSSQTLARQPGIRQVAKKLPAEGLAVGYLSPGGMVAFADQMIGLFAAAEKKPFTLPKFPATPPVGWVISPRQNAIEAEAVLPVEVISAVMAYVPQVKQAVTSP